LFLAFLSLQMRNFNVWTLFSTTTNKNRIEKKNTPTRSQFCKQLESKIWLLMFLYKNCLATRALVLSFEFLWKFHFSTHFVFHKESKLQRFVSFSSWLFSDISRLSESKLVQSAMLNVELHNYYSTEFHHIVQQKHWHWILIYLF
jgi:hypothetical protein